MKLQFDLFGEPADLTNINHTLREVFVEWYISREGNTAKIEYYWTAKDAAHMTQLSTKIRKLLDGRGRDPKDGEAIILSMKYILSNLPEWINEAPSVSVINSQWMTIINTILNGRKQQVSPDSIERYIQETGEN